MRKISQNQEAGGGTNRAFEALNFRQRILRRTGGGAQWSDSGGDARPIGSGAADWQRLVTDVEGRFSTNY
jgi:hypothetical protein